VEKQYRLPVSAMVEILKASMEQVVLRAQLPAVPGVSKKACLARLIVGQGTVCSCAVTTPNGEILLKHQEAYQALLRCGDLEWLVEPFPGFSPLSKAPADIQQMLASVPHLVHLSTNP